MSTFDREKYIIKKVDEYAGNLAYIIKGLGGDPIAISKGLTNSFKTSLEIVIDSTVKDEITANKKFANRNM